MIAVFCNDETCANNQNGKCGFSCISIGIGRADESGKNENPPCMSYRRDEKCRD